MNASSAALHRVLLSAIQQIATSFSSHFGWPLRRFGIFRTDASWVGNTWVGNILTLQGGKYVGVDFIHIQCLERGEWTLQSDKFHNRFVNSRNSDYEIASARFLFVYLHLGLGPDGLFNFASPGLERASLLACFNGDNLATGGGSLLWRLLGLGSRRLLRLGGRCLLRRGCAGLLAGGRRTRGAPRHGHFDFSSFCEL